jgi:hypothetical protein
MLAVLLLKGKYDEIFCTTVYYSCHIFTALFTALFQWEILYLQIHKNNVWTSSKSAFLHIVRFEIQSTLTRKKKLWSFIVSFLLTGVIITSFPGIISSRFTSVDCKVSGVFLHFVSGRSNIFANNLDAWNSLKQQSLSRDFEDYEQTESLERENVISCRCRADDFAVSPVHVFKSPRFTWV